MPPLSTPHSIDDPQRRLEHRVNVPLAKGIALSIADERGATLHGELRDLSPSGFAARITHGEPGHFADGRRGQCEIALPDSAPLRAVVEICHVIAGQRHGVPRIGGCFIDLDARSERRLERYTAELEREQVRRR